MKVLAAFSLGMCSATALLGGPASATETYCAEVKQTNDGFVPLREGPGTHFKMLLRLLPKDRLWLNTGSCWRGKCSADRRWSLIEGVQRVDGSLDHAQTYMQGWVSSSLIQVTACPDK